MFSSLARYDLNWWLWWSIVTAAGTTAGLFLVALILVNLGLPFLVEMAEGQTPSLLDQIVVAPIFALTGVAIGLAQWFSLRQLIPGAGWWIVATPLGWLFGYLATVLMAALGPTTNMSGTAALVPWLVIGLATGICQWLLLRAHYQRAGWWLPVATLAMAIGATGWVFGGICGGGLTWLAAGGLTGFTILWLGQ